MLVSIPYIFFIRKGSLIVDYEVIIPILNTNETNVIAIDKKLHKAATNWKNFDGKKVDIEMTKSAITSKSMSDFYLILTDI